MHSWYSCHGYEGLYEISLLGLVRNTRTKQILKQEQTETGYFRVDLYKDGKRKHEKVHRLVAKTFLPNPGNKPEVNHINRKKHHNSVYNLEWVTGSENIKHLYKTGYRKHKGV